MAKRVYTVKLTDTERRQLEEIVVKGEESVRTILRANILLHSDVAYPKKYTVNELAEELKTTNTTVQTTRTEYGQGGIDFAVFRKKRVVPTGSYKADEETIEKIKALYEGTPPEGHKKWSTRLLCNACVEQGILEHIAPSTMSVLLRKIYKQTE
ncbi:COG3415 family protein [Lactonifactor longoviformis]|uniref:hypothetical protein n=1 Tax=Lactonifactor longoviformis TaxID=341220 RepID=UPI001D02E006|nr:hypothetical protein [Lactonifactor longoviformis]MCB5715056.1 hypothetical protein [Lactonifactor longoviformis]MCB5719023.1 hypothetical protein [Lactonifactor longoviformis]